MTNNITESERVLKELERKETEIDMREKNLRAMQEVVHNEHLAETQLIKRIAESIIRDIAKSEHLCINVERFARLEGKIDAVLQNQEDFKKNQTELFAGKNSNSERIGKLETTWKVSTSIIVAVIVGSWTVFSWMFDNLKDMIQALGAIAHK